MEATYIIFKNGVAWALMRNERKLAIPFMAVWMGEITRQDAKKRWPHASIYEWGDSRLSNEKREIVEKAEMSSGPIRNKFLKAAMDLHETVEEDVMLPMYVAISIYNDANPPVRFRKELAPSDDQSMESLYSDLIDGKFLTHRSHAITPSQQQLIFSLQEKCKQHG